jgi:hypothetical protein
VVHWSSLLLSGRNPLFSLYEIQLITVTVGGTYYESKRITNLVSTFSVVYLVLSNYFPPFRLLFFQGPSSTNMKFVLIPLHYAHCFSLRGSISPRSLWWPQTWRIYVVLYPMTVQPPWNKVSHHGIRSPGPSFTSIVSISQWPYGVQADQIGYIGYSRSLPQLLFM